MDEQTEEATVLGKYFALFEKIYREVLREFGSDLDAEQHFRLTHTLALVPFSHREAVRELKEILKQSER